MNARAQQQSESEVCPGQRQWPHHQHTYGRRCGSGSIFPRILCHKSRVSPSTRAPVEKDPEAAGLFSIPHYGTMGPRPRGGVQGTPDPALEAAAELVAQRLRAMSPALSGSLSGDVLLP